MAWADPGVDGIEVCRENQLVFPTMGVILFQSAVSPVLNEPGAFAHTRG